MATLALPLLPLDSVAYAQASSPTYDFVSAASSISAFTSTTSFTPYSISNQKMEGWIALGDSDKARSGYNRLNEILAVDVVPRKRAFPMEMSADTNDRGFINGDDTLPRFTFSAYTSDTTVELVSEQLTQGAFVTTNIIPPRHAMASLSSRS